MAVGSIRHPFPSMRVCCVSSRRGVALSFPLYPSSSKLPLSACIRPLSSRIYCLSSFAHSQPSASARELFGIEILPEDIESRNLGIKTDISWLSLSDEEFAMQLDGLRHRIPDFGPSMLCPDERRDFCARRYELVCKCAEEGSKLIGKVDLITPLLEFRNASRIVMKPNAKESADEESVETELLATRSKIVSESSQAFMPLWMDTNKTILRVQAWSQVALDTQLWIYTQQSDLPESRKYALTVLELLKLPLEFFVGAATYTEATYVMMKEGCKLQSTMARPSWCTRMSFQVKIFIIASLKALLILLVKKIPHAIIKKPLGWCTKYLNELIKAAKVANAHHGDTNRATRLAAIDKLFKTMLDSYKLADYEAITMTSKW